MVKLKNIFYLPKILHKFQNYTNEWDFKCRDSKIKFTPEMVKEITEQIKHFCTLTFKDEDLDYLSSLEWIKPSYINFLRYWAPFFSDFEISTEDEQEEHG